MKLIYTVLAFVSFASIVNAQQQSGHSQTSSLEDSLNKSLIRKVEVTREFDLSPSMFVSNTIPSDVPQKNQYSTNELYIKVIQGYINTHSELFIKSEVEKVGFSYPVIIDPTKVEKKRNSDKFKRIVPISEEEKEIKRSKESLPKN